MALFHGKSYRVAILSLFFHLSSLIPFLQPSNADALTQRSNPPSAAVLTSPYVPNIAVLLSRGKILFRRTILYLLIIATAGP